MNTLATEQKYWKKGYRTIACLDEVGRGPLAGPVTACAVSISSKTMKLDDPVMRDFCMNRKDSKKLSRTQRERISALCKQTPWICYAFGSSSQSVIDARNVSRATHMAMRLALVRLQKKLSRKRPIDLCIVDGKGFALSDTVQTINVVKGDETVFSCKIASVLAKVHRDALMGTYHHMYPLYNFAQHKGYGTQKHMKALRRYGPCTIHRKTFLHAKNVC